MLDNKLIFSDLDICLDNYFKSRLKLFKKLLGLRVIDVLFHMPSYVIEKTYVEQVSKSDIGKIITTKIKIDCIDINYNSSKPIIIYGKSGGELVEILLFNYKKSYAKSMFQVNKEICISGKLGESFSQILQFINPEKILQSNLKDNFGLFNIYPLSAGISQKAIYSVMKSALEILAKSEIQEWIPENIIEKNEFQNFYDSLKNIHFPQNFYENQLNTPFRKRIAFDEFLAEQVVIRLSNPKTKVGNVVKNEKNLIKKLLEILPFCLTDSQNKVIYEIFQDLERGNPMTRLLQGDVGSGKTIVAIITALYVIESGYQCAILAPTEILARQHYFTIKKYFEKLGLSIELLTSNEKGKKRAEIFEKTQTGKLHLLVGTHAIISENVKFQNLGLVIIDEQHRFGVNQRLNLIEKGVSPHVLSMTATPIPRTIIMSLYGDISVSSLMEKPSGRKEIITKAVPINRIMEVIDSMRNIINKGQKIYWICPLIEENEKLKYTCVINRFEFLKKYFENDVEMLHGKMKPNEKQAIFEKFNNGECKILVSTTVIEVGVDVPDASVIFIENAEKFGLAQLHQLRGRVGRSDLQSYCILLFDTKISEIARKRINIIRENNDGFKIAEHDLTLRGGGEILGTKQSGQKIYKTFDINDPNNQTCLFDLMKQASDLATKIIETETAKNYELLLKIFREENFEIIKLSF